MKKEKDNYSFKSPKDLNRTIYIWGIDGSFFLTIIGLAFAISFGLAILLNNLILLFPFVVIIIGVLSTYLKSICGEKLKKDNHSDPLHRAFQKGSLMKNYRDYNSFFKRRLK